MLPSDILPSENTFSMPSGPESFLPGISFKAPHSKWKLHMMCLIGNTHVTCWWIPRDGSHAGRPCAVGHKLMDHMLTLKEAEPVSCCSLLQAGFIFLKHREMTLEVLGSKEKKKQMSSPLNKRKNAREKMKSYFQHLYSPFHLFLP